MTIDETIENERKAADKYRQSHKDESNYDYCNKMTEEHEQLADWLEELKDYRDKNKIVVKIDVENIDSMKDKCIEIAKEYYNKALDDFINAYYKYCENQSGILVDDEIVDMGKVKEKLVK